MPSRRVVLATVGSAAIVGMAGCSGSGSGNSETVDCHTSALNHGDGDVLNTGASGTVEDGNVMLAIPLSVDDVQENDLDRLEVYDAADTLTHTIPVSADDAGLMGNKVGVEEGQLLYEQTLGRRPFHGQYRITAVDRSNEIVDFVTVEFNCFTDVSN